MKKEENLEIEPSSNTLSTDLVSGVNGRSIWEAAQKLGLPVAMWRLPNSSTIQLIVSFQKDIQVIQPELEELPAGFILSAFHNNENESVNFIKADARFTFEVDDDQVFLSDYSSSEEFQLLIVHAKQVYADASNSIDNVVLEQIVDIEARKRYMQIVRLGADAVKRGDFKKVVLSRKKDYLLKADFPFVSNFLALVDAYKTAFVSLVHIPSREETWLGATPEILVDVQNQRYFRTVALAGTQSAFTIEGTLKSRYEVLWSEKEIEEQALVGRYIIECFKRIRLREYAENGPRSHLAGNLYHLCSDFEVDMQSVNFPELGSVMLKLLHPTSAVCGMPKKEATDFLEAVEGYDRSFYSGFLGPVNVEGGIHLFVNLRTMRVQNHIASFFAGAGITAESDPLKEWEETEMKCQTLLRVFERNYIK